MQGLKLDESQRIDIWLYRARFFKSRALSGRFVSRRKVRLTRGGCTHKLSKPHFCLRVGDQLTFVNANKLIIVEILALGLRRGPASEATQLYRVISTDG
ncbi:MAG TPA: RNA-binding S4 domain-containing protein [Hellea balneolensis]|uniref:RNA-binding S4 domain-containing protein n=1 Tax=Hellea balneolensis TaxID=287478 RepID=A0A7C5LZ25_9PROT|nr:RNA-binding S4 domain-containing protein [Hellea balneolensis]